MQTVSRLKKSVFTPIVSISVTQCPNPHNFTTDEITTTEVFDEDLDFEDIVW